MPYRVIGVTGKMQSGKTTLCKHLFAIAEKHHKSAAVIAFADPLKDVCRTLFGGEARNYHGTQADKNEDIPEYWKTALNGRCRTYRELMQYVGTEIFRALHQDFWVLKYAERVSAALQKYDIVLTPDVRFDNEAECIIAHHGAVVRLTRRDGITVADGIENHASEAGVSPQFLAADFIVDYANLNIVAYNVATKFLGIRITSPYHGGDA